MDAYFDFLDRQSEATRDMVIYLHELLTSLEGTTLKMRYSLPFYYGHKWICYINPVRKGVGVELVFLQARHLSNIHGFLQSRGRKMVMGMTFNSLDAIPESVVLETMKEALAYDLKKAKSV